MPHIYNIYVYYTPFYQKKQWYKDEKMVNADSKYMQLIFGNLR